MPFAAIIDGLSINNPYNNHNATPKTINKYIGRDNPFTSLVFQTLYAWGKKADVVKAAAIKPIISI